MIVMDFMMVEPKKAKFSAYHFNGSETSAKEASEKWECIIGRSENFDNKYVITFGDGQKCFPNSYIVIEQSKPVVYTQEEFVTKYQVAYDLRDRIGSFYSMD
jgi:hypothetical protein